MSLVTSLVTKKIFWILFPKITVGDIPEMLSIKVNITMFLVFKKEIKFVLFQNFGEKFEISVLQGTQF